MKPWKPLPPVPFTSTIPEILDEIEGRWPEGRLANSDAREDVLALIARVRELEAECERQSATAAKTFNALIANDIAQMRAYGLSYEGVRALLGDFDDGDITFAKLMDLIRAAARAMAEDEARERRAKATEGWEEPGANVVTAGDLVGLRRKE